MQAVAMPRGSRWMRTRMTCTTEIWAGPPPRGKEADMGQFSIKKEVFLAGQGES